jgi:putative MATE family efflux protein
MWSRVPERRVILREWDRFIVQLSPVSLEPALCWGRVSVSYLPMDLVKDPIPRLIRQIALPASVGFFFNTMFNVVDTFYAGLDSTDALAALAVSFPIFFSIIALGAGIGQGATALIANALGEGDLERAHRISLQSVSFGLLTSVLLTALGLWSAPVLFRFLGAEGLHLTLAMDYMNTILLGLVFFLVQSTLNATLHAQGNTRTFRNVLMVGCLLNVVLDPWFMFGGWGLPAMGLRGIALATVLIQAGGALYLLHRVRRTRIWRGWRWEWLKPDRAHYRDIAGQGLPASLNMLTVALGIFLITWFVAQFSKEGVAAYGIATRIEQIFLLPTIGLHIAILSLTGQNNGAGRFDRIREAYWTSIRYGLGLMLAAGVLIWIAGGWMMSVFTSDPVVIGIGGQYLRVASITLCSYVILFQTVYMLQGLRKPIYALWVGIYRQLIAPILVFWLLAFRLDWKLPGIWWGIFLVTWSAALFMLWFGGWKLRRMERDAMVRSIPSTSARPGAPETSSCSRMKC